MNRRLDVVASQKAQTVTGVHCQAVIHGLDPFPSAGLRVFDLKRRNGLSKEQCDGATIGVAASIEAVAKPRQLVGGEWRVFHVS